MQSQTTVDITVLSESQESITLAISYTTEFENARLKIGVVSDGTTLPVNLGWSPSDEFIISRGSGKINTTGIGRGGGVYSNRIAIEIHDLSSLQCSQDYKTNIGNLSRSPLGIYYSECSFGKVIEHIKYWP